jgi:hypothetical protein
MKIKSRGCNKNTLQSLAWNVSLIFLYIRFFTNFSTNILYIVYTLFLMSLTILISGKKELETVYRSELTMLVVVLLICILSPYSKMQMFKYVILLFDAELLYKRIGLVENQKGTKIFYYFCVFYITFNFAVFLYNSSLYSIIFAKGVPQQYPFFTGLNDCNNTGVILFLFFVLSVKKRGKLGIVLSLTYPLLYFGRQYILMILIFCFLFYILKFKITRHGFKLRKDELEIAISKKIFFLLL